ncbi:hypothetical protein HOI83_00370 [Candidatus Uhrbacteria bacterium]|jgi:hypothetical protein|nr:hypothetical protein [Candidatus Uhrbacteria bacterium]
MTNVFRHLLAPIAIITMIFGGALALAAPGFVNEASAAASSTLTTGDILPTTFSGETGLGNRDLKSTIGGIIRSALGFLGVIAVVITLYGGFLWMTAGGKEEQVKKAQQVIVAGAIGLAIILSAWAITTFIVTELIGATSAPATSL